MKNFTKVLNNTELQTELKAFVDDAEHDEIQDGTHLILDATTFIDTAQFSNEDGQVYRITRYELVDGIYDINAFNEEYKTAYKELEVTYLAEKSDLADYLHSEIMKNGY